MSDYKIDEIRARHRRLEDMRSSIYSDETSDSWTYFGTWAAHHDRAYLLAENDRICKALTSIARNTCCDRCQEAALVARRALERNP